MIDIKVPTVGESISEVTLVKWLKKEGDYVNRDEVLCELESEKATFELTAEQAGTLHIVGQEGDTLKIGDLACSIDETAAKPEGVAAPAPSVATLATPTAPAPKKEEKATPAAAPTATSDVKATPVANAIMSDKHVKPTEVKGTGSQGRILKQDVLEALNNPGKKGGDA